MSLWRSLDKRKIPWTVHQVTLTIPSRNLSQGQFTCSDLPNVHIFALSEETGLPRENSVWVPHWMEISPEHYCYKGPWSNHNHGQDGSFLFRSPRKTIGIGSSTFHCHFITAADNFLQFSSSFSFAVLLKLNDAWSHTSKLFSIYNCALHKSRVRVIMC